MRLCETAAARETSYNCYDQIDQCLGFLGDSKSGALPELPSTNFEHQVRVFNCKRVEMASCWALARRAARTASVICTVLCTHACQKLKLKPI